jgi:hypothetical protein
LSYKFSEGLDDKIRDSTLLKFEKKNGEFIKMPLTNKKVFSAIGIDAFCDTVTMHYTQPYSVKAQRNLEEFNLYLKSRYDILLEKKWISDSHRKAKGLIQN